MTEREIFLGALDCDTPEARAAYLHQACGGDASLRHKVEELLREHFGNDSLLAGPAVEGGGSEVQSPPTPAPMVGRYKLLEKIGECGFGGSLDGGPAGADQTARRPQDHQAGHGQPADRRPVRG